MHPPAHHPRGLSGASLLQKGDLIAGKYRVEKVIGQGGQSQVVSARHIELGNLFAIKVLRPEGDASNVVRFTREAQALSRLQNEHVVRVHDVGQTDTGLAFMVMEHLDGQDLNALLAARGPLPVDEAVGALLEACEGLADAHAMGIVHRDIKPANIFLARKSVTGDATVKVVDFGLAKAVSSNTMGKGINAKATFDGEIVGTGGYIAPEQLGGEATPRSDVWSLGVSLYKLLTGKHPFAGKNAVELSLAALTGEIRPMHYFREDVPPSIEAVIARCLRKIPEERYADAKALGDALLLAYSDDPLPQSNTAATLTRGVARSAASVRNDLVHRDAEGTVTIVTPRHDFVDAPPPSTFSISEAGLDPKTRMALLYSAIALSCALLFLLSAVAWRHSRQHAATQPVEPPAVTTAAVVPVIVPPPPPPPPPVEVAAPVPTPEPPPVETVTPPPPVPEPIAEAVPEPVAAPPVAAAPAMSAPKPASPKKPKKALYDTP